MIDENGSFGMGRSKKGPDQDRVYIYWLRKIDSGFCFQNQENRTLNEIIFLKKKKKTPSLPGFEPSTLGLPGLPGIHSTRSAIDTPLKGSNF